MDLLRRAMKQTRIASFAEVITELQRSQEITSGAAITICLADRISSFTLGNVQVTLATPTRLRMQGRAGVAEVALNGATILPPETSWPTLDNARQGFGRAPAF